MDSFGNKIPWLPSPFQCVHLHPTGWKLTAQIKSPINECTSHFFFFLSPPPFFFSQVTGRALALAPFSPFCILSPYSASHPSQRSRPRTHSSAVSSDPCQAFPSSLPEFPDMGRQSSRMKEGQHFTHPKLLQTTFPIKVWFSWRMKGCFRKHCKDLSPFEIFFPFNSVYDPYYKQAVKPSVATMSRKTLAKSSSVSRRWSLL